MQVQYVTNSTMGMVSKSIISALATDKHYNSLKILDSSDKAYSKTRNLQHKIGAPVICDNFDNRA